MRCRTADHVCVTMTGTTKSKSGPSTMALLRDPRLQLDRQSPQAYQATSQLTLDADRIRLRGRAARDPAPAPCMTCSTPQPGFAGYNIARENAYRVAWELTLKL